MSWFTEVLFLIPNWAWFVIIVGIFCVLMAIVIVTCCSKKGDKQEDKNEPEPVLMNEQTEQENEREKHEEKAEEVKEQKTEEVVYTEPEPVLVEEPVQSIKKEPAKKTATKSTTAKTTPAKTSAAKSEKTTAAKPAATKSTATKSTTAKTSATKSAAKPAKSDADDNKVYHISKRKEENKWQVKAEGSSKALKLFLTQDEAIEYAKSVAGNQEGRIVIHKEDGGFRKLKY